MGSTFKPTWLTLSMNGSDIMEKVFEWKSHPLANNVIGLERKGMKHPYGSTLKLISQTLSMDGSNIMVEVFVRKSYPVVKNVIHLERKYMK